MKITYIYHSGFSIEFEDVIMLFDYYKGQLPDFPPDKPVYVFVSHKHPDHFNKDIFHLVNRYQDITFILSSDTKMNESYMNRINLPQIAREKILYIGKNAALSLPAISVETLTSTDQGVAYIVTYLDKVIYHAGDLNWWSWNGETEKEYKDMTGRFFHEMEKIKNRSFDVAFMTLDPRQEDRFWWGFDYFMKTTATKTVFPMHFEKDYSIIRKLKEREESKEYKDRVMDIKEMGQEFII